LINLRGSRNVENQNVEGSERQKFFKDDQNVKRSEHQKSEHRKERQKANLSDFQILMKCQLPMAYLNKTF